MSFDVDRAGAFPSLATYDDEMGTPGSVADRKSVLVSGLLSFFLGPLGWFYAAPLSSAAIGGGAYVLAGAILPQFLMVYVVALVAPLSAIAGVFYAIGYNMSGERMPLFGGSKEPKRLGRG